VSHEQRFPAPRESDVFPLNTSFYQSPLSSRMTQEYKVPLEWCRA
jgi:hypothetical protein